MVLADARAVEQLRSLHRLVARRHQQQQQLQRAAQRSGPHPAATSRELHVGRSSVREFANPVAAAADVLAALGVTP